MSNDEFQSDDQSKLERVLADYLHSVESGIPLDRSALIKEHPELAAELKSFSFNRDAVEKLAAPIQAQAPEDFQTLGMDQEPTPGAGNRVRYLGDYELLEEIARGGMGVVFKARQASLNRIVAVKMILAGQLADDSAVKRFRQEAEAAANLDHPHIVPVFEVGEHQGQQYFSMGFVDGQSLAAKLASGPLAPREAAELIEQVARAVQYAHERGVIHRDLKPANVLLDRQGRPKVTDFGLAKLATRDQSLTDTGQVLGTPGYMPPEQVDGKPAGPQADVYGLGAILYALLTGRPPFQAATPMETMLQVLSADPAPPQQLNPSVPRDLDTIVCKCLEKWPEQRYQTAGELAEDLRRFVAGEPIKARRPGVIENGIRWLHKQSRGVAIAFGATAATLALAAIGLAGWMWYQDWRLGHVMLATDRPPIVAELFDEENGTAAPSFTVPTQEPLPVSAGEYRVSFSADGRLSQSYRLSVERGEVVTPHSVNLEDRLLASPNDLLQLMVERDYALVDRNGKADVVLLDFQGLRRPAWPSGGKEWTVKLVEPQQNADLVNAPGLIWPWTGNIGNVEFAHPVLAPQVMRQAPDLDGDGIEDVIVAARHQAWILAVSAAEGKVLWLAVRSADVKDTPPQGDFRQTHYNARPSAVLGTPVALGDLDGDGVGDLLATFADGRNWDPKGSTSPAEYTRFWLECISGKTGDSIWQFDFAPERFQLPQGVEIPEEARWMIRVIGRIDGGTSFNNERGRVERSFGSPSLRGQSQFAPYPVQVVQCDGRSIAVTLAGTRVIGLDVDSGKPAWEPFDIGSPAARAPQFADLDGDGVLELLVVQSQPVPLNSSSGAPRHPNRRQTAVSMWPLKSDSKPVWKHVFNAERRAPWNFEAAPIDWPIVADLDGDERKEIAVPNSTWDAASRRWSREVEVVDGVSGQSRWRRMLKMMDPQIDAFLAGPDVDGDGCRELFTATLVGERYDLYVDALSGKDGRSVRWGSRQIDKPYYIAGLSRWNAGEDGWPQLLVSTAPESYGNNPPITYAFSAGSAQCTGSISEIDNMRFADGDGDGVADMFALDLSLRGAPNLGGTLQAFRGVATERWRRLGGKWQTAGDYDSDGHADLISVAPLGMDTLSAVSGRDGRKLWRTKLDMWPNVVAAQPLALDLDGDQVADIAVYRKPSGNMTGIGARDAFPLAAVSGRTGQTLWTVDRSFSQIDGIFFVEALDLENDGKPEVVFTTFTNWDAIGSPDSKYWLAILDGRTGKVRWTHPLSVQFGSHYSAAVAPAFVDVNRDSVTDILMPSEVSTQKFEMRAVSGRDGTTLWGRSLDPALIEVVWREWVTPLVTDLDGDGRLEVIGLEYSSANVANYPNKRHARVFALEAATGKELWKWETPVDSTIGTVWRDGKADELKLRPLVLRRKDGRPLVAFAVWGYEQDGRLVFLDDAGQLVAETTLPKADVPYLVTRSLDANGDGNDEVILLDHNKLRAIAVRQSDSGYEAADLWQWSRLPETMAKIIDIVDAEDGGPTVVVQGAVNIYGISAATGTVAWTITAPQPRTADGGFVWPTADLLISPSKDTHSAVFQWNDHIAVCRDARPINSPVAMDELRAAPLPTARNDNKNIAPDDRFQRKPTWATDSFARSGSISADARDVDRAEIGGIYAWRLMLATFMIVLPIGTLVTIIAHRRWSLRMFLLLPFLAGVVISLLLLPTPGVFQAHAVDSIEQRLGDAANGVPVVLFLYLLMQYARNRRWRSLLGWITAVLLMAAFIVVLTYLAECRSLAPGERFDFSDWDLLLAYAFYATAFIAMFAMLITAAIRWFRSVSVKTQTSTENE